MIYGWRKRNGTLEPADVMGPCQLEQDNSRLKKLVMDRDLKLDVMETSVNKNGMSADSATTSEARGEPQGAVAARICAT